MTVMLSPYHLDEHRPDPDYPLTPDAVAAPDGRDGDVWARLGSMYQSVAGLVAADTRAGGRPVVRSGDRTTSLGTMAGLQPRAGRARTPGGIAQQAPAAWTEPGGRSGAAGAG